MTFKVFCDLTLTYLFGRVFFSIFLGNLHQNHLGPMPTHGVRLLGSLRSPSL